MSPSLPVGTDEVGFEPIVLPVSASLTVGATWQSSVTCRVVAPTCRYGRALYRPVAVWPGGELSGEEEDLVGSSGWCMCPLPIGEQVLRVELRMVLLCFRFGAFDRMAPEELALALNHPLRSVREAALLSLGR